MAVTEIGYADQASGEHLPSIASQSAGLRGDEPARVLCEAAPYQIVDGAISELLSGPLCGTAELLPRLLMSTPGRTHACARDGSAEPDAARASTPDALSSSLSRNALIGLLWALLFQGGTLALGYGVFRVAQVVYRWMTGVSL